MTQKLLPKVNSVEGEINLPGSKSLSNRALLLAALAPGQTTLLNLLRSEDTQRMVEALTQLGVSLTMNDDWSRCVVSLSLIHI